LPPEPVSVSAIAWKIATPALIAIGKHGIKKLLEKDFLFEAVSSTAIEFPQFVALNHSLNEWCNSDEFIEILKSFKERNDKYADEAIIDSFVTVGGFHTGNETNSDASAVIKCFFNNIERELFKSIEGLFVHDKKQEALHCKTQNMLLALNEQIKEHTLNHIQTSDEIEVSLEEKIINARIDEARKLINKGHPITAKDLLVEIIEDISDKESSSEINFRIHTNLGACALDLGDTDKAIQEFKKALEFQPDNSKALSNAALSEILLENPVKALEYSSKAYELSPNDSHTNVIYLKALNYAGKHSDIETLIESNHWIKEDTNCSLILGEFAFDRKEYETAKKYFQKASENNNPSAYDLLALSIFIPIKNELQNNPPFLGILSDEAIELLSEAEKAVTKSIEIYRGYENRNRILTALTNRAGIRAVLGKDKDALTDCDSVLSENPDNNTTIENKARLLITMSKYSEAVETLESIYSPESPIGICLLLSFAYIEDNKADKAIEVLEPHWNPEIRDEIQLKVADILIRAFTSKNETEKAIKIIENLKSLWDRDPNALVVIAHYYKATGHPIESISHLEAALEYSQLAQKKWIFLEIADIYHENRDYDKAAKNYEHIVDKNEDSPILRKFLISLFNAGYYTEALSISQNIRGEGDAIPLVTEIEAMILEYTGEYANAKKLYYELSIVEPQNTAHLIRLLSLQMRENEKEEAIKTLALLKYEDIKDNSEVLIRVAQGYAHLRKPEAIKYAYRARQIDYLNPDVQMAYIGLIFGPISISDLLDEPSVVAVDTTVSLQRVEVADDDTETLLNEKVVYTIEPDEQTLISKGHITNSSSLAVKLVGLKKDDIVYLKEAGLEVLSYKVVEIKNKYIHAAQESMAEFATLFPDNTSIQKIDVKDKDFSKLFKVIDDREEFIRNIINLYKSKNLTIGFLALRTGQSIFDVLSGMIKRQDGWIYSSTGNPADTSKEITIVESNSSIALDSTALYTLSYLEILEKLPIVFQSIYVPQALVDEINEIILQIPVEHRPSMTVGKQGDKYVREDVLPEDYKGKRKYLQGLIDFFKENTFIVSSKGVFIRGREELEDLEKALTKGSVATLDIAKEKNLPIYTDDARLKLVGKQPWGVDGFWTQTVLNVMLKKEIISEDEYHRLTVKLALSNYFFTSINAQDIFWALKAAKQKINDDIVKLFNLLNGPDCSDESAIIVFTDLLQIVWLEISLLQQKIIVLDLSLKALATGRDFRAVINMLKNRLKVKFYLQPIALREILENIDIWASQKLI
jgi:tetratricopeptide (TPR) repeat protein